MVVVSKVKRSPTRVAGFASRLTSKPEVSADLRSDGPPVHPWDWRKLTGTGKQHGLAWADA
jgi:hypothetical protein